MVFLLKLLFIFFIISILKKLWRAYKIYKLIADRRKDLGKQEKTTTSNDAIEAEYRVVDDEDGE